VRDESRLHCGRDGSHGKLSSFSKSFPSACFTERCPPALEYPCKYLKPKLDCEIRTMGEASSHFAPTGQISFASLSFQDPSRVPKFHRNHRIICWAWESNYTCVPWKRTNLGFVHISGNASTNTQRQESRRLL
jgi:hypothetical protein